MSVRAVTRSLGVLILSASLVCVGGAAQGASKPGTVLALPKVKAQIINDTEAWRNNPAACYAPVLAKSDRNWGLLSPNLAPDSTCRPGWYAIPVVYKVKGKWKKINLPPNRTCKWVKGVLVGKYNAPASIIDDFKAARYCT